MTLDQSTMMAPLLAADPSFEGEWQAFVAEWRDDPPLPLFLIAADYARHLLQRMERRDTAGFEQVFAVIERWITDGDNYTDKAAVTGFIEALQNHLGGNDRGFVSTGGVRASDFERWLGPASAKAWEDLYTAWEG